MTGPHSFTASAFGLRWLSDLPLAPFAPAPPGPPEITVQRTDWLAPRARLRIVNTGEVNPDGLRVNWGNEAVFDMIGGDQIAYLPGPAWTGQLPASLFGTVAALTLAWRGALPLHACAVEVAGEAFLIAGPSGSGKSVLTADLLALGARFVGDDLSVVHPASCGPTICPGRATMRLHPMLAGEIDADDRQPVLGDERGKWQLRPRGRTMLQEMPVAGMVLLGDARRAALPVERPGLLMKQLFRPRWLAALPDHRKRLEQILHYGSSLPIICYPAIGATTVRDRARRAGEAMEAITAMGRT